MIKVSAKLRQYYKEYMERDLPEEYKEKYESVREFITSGKFDDMPMIQFGQYVLEREKENV